MINRDFIILTIIISLDKQGKLLFKIHSLITIYLKILHLLMTIKEILKIHRPEIKETKELVPDKLEKVINMTMKMIMMKKNMKMMIFNNKLTNKPKKIWKEYYIV